MNYISFPGIGLGPVLINHTAFYLFGREIRWYGIVICIGIILAFLYTQFRARQEGISLDDMLDYVIITVPVSIVCARIYFVLTSLSEYDNFYDMIAIWNGGIAIYGAVIGGFFSIIAISKFKKIKALKVLDAVAPGVMIGQIIGRFGNFFNAEAYGNLDYAEFLGKVVHTPDFENNFFLRMVIQDFKTGRTITVHPTFLYEAVWNAVGLLIINAFYKRKKFDGQIVIMYFTWYGFGRFFIEGLRSDSLYIGKIKISQLLALLFFVTGVILLACFTIKARKNCRKLDGYVEKF